MFQNLTKSFKTCCTSEDYSKIRQLLKDYGVEKFKNDMVNKGIFSDDIITSENNPFAKFVTGKMENPCHDKLDNDSYIIVQNLEQANREWMSADVKWLGKASMSKRHKFLVPTNLRWSTFNILTFGMDSDFDNMKCIELLNEMENVALKYTSNYKWSDNIGLFFHCYPFNSVQTLHLHIVDMNFLGPSYYHNNFKNISLNSVRNVLMDEIKN